MSRDCSYSLDLRDNVQTMLHVKGSINLLFAKHKMILERIKTQSSVQPSVETLMTISQNIAFTDNPPKGWVVGVPLISAHPPAVQAEQMRTGFLEAHHLKSSSSDKRIHSHANKPQGLESQLRAKTELTFLSDKLHKRKREMSLIHSAAFDTSSASAAFNYDSKVAATDASHRISDQKAFLDTKLPEAASRELKISFGAFDSSDSSEDET